MKQGLYAYFGLLELHTIDSPGHFLYQIGLLDSLQVEYGIEKFDFFSYYPIEEIQKTKITRYPDTALGDLFSEYYESLVRGCFTQSEVLDRISNKEYDSLYLKARFRNLSTLTKKWRDALAFESIIDRAIASGYTKDKIIILDTDLSLSYSFYQKYDAQVTIKIPSIDFPAISSRFLKSCVQIHKVNYAKKKDIVFYGNLDTSSYKNGNAKSENLFIFINEVLKHQYDNQNKLVLICKNLDAKELLNTQDGAMIQHIPRNDRSGIWNALNSSAMMLNITKEKYNESQFIPARIYEAMIFGMIPISYGFEFLSPTFSFRNTEDLSEILKYLSECDSEDLIKAYLHFIKDYDKYIKKACIKE